MHKNEYLVRELLDAKGVAFTPDGVRRLKGGDIESAPKQYRGREFIDSYSNLLCDRIAAKAHAAKIVVAVDRIMGCPIRRVVNAQSVRSGPTEIASLARKR